MNANVEKIHEKLYELMDMVKEAFPEYSKTSVYFSNDGYIDFTVVKFGEGDDIETTPRKDLYQQVRLANNTDWEDERSSDQNEYYDSIGLLLKE